MEVWKLAHYSVAFPTSFGEYCYSRVWASQKEPISPTDRTSCWNPLSWILWSIWLARHQLIFQQREFSPEETIVKALSDGREWMFSQTQSPKSRTKPFMTIPCLCFRRCSLEPIVWMRTNWLDHWWYGIIDTTFRTTSNGGSHGCSRSHKLYPQLWNCITGGILRLSISGWIGLEQGSESGNL